MIKKLTSLFIVACSLIVYSQQAAIDSLNKSLEGTELTVEEKALSLINLAQEYLNSSLPDSSIFCLEMASSLIDGLNDTLYLKAQYQLSDITLNIDKIRSNSILDKIIEKSYHLGYRKLHAQYLANKSLRLQEEEAYDKAILLSDSALRINKRINQRKGTIENLNTLGTLHWRKGNYVRAIQCYSQSIDFMNEKEGLNMARTLNNIGIIYQEQGLNNRAIDEYLKALKIVTKDSITQGVAFLNNNIGVVYNDLEEQHLAIHHFNKADSIFTLLNMPKNAAMTLNNIAGAYLKLTNYDTALLFYKSSLVKSKSLDFKSGMAKSYHGMGDVYLETNRPVYAGIYYDSSIVLKTFLGQKKELAESYLQVGRAYLNQDKVNKALSFVKKSQKLAEETLATQQLSSTYGLLSEIYEKQGNYVQSLNAHKQFKLLSDSLLSSSFKSEIFKKQAAYELSQRELELKNEKLLLETVLKNDLRVVRIRNKTLSLALVLFVFLIIAIFISYRKIKKEQTGILQLNGEIEQANLEIRNQNNKISVLNEILGKDLDEVTKKLLYKNEKLSEFAFFNSHETRAPLARLLTLVELLKTHKVDPSTSKLHNNIKNAALELDAIIKTINEILEEGKLSQLGE